eukprot:877617-Prymnesium_polylepis.1
MGPAILFAPNVHSARERPSARRRCGQSVRGMCGHYKLAHAQSHCAPHNLRALGLHAALAPPPPLRAPAPPPARPHSLPCAVPPPPAPRASPHSPRSPPPPPAPPPAH